MIINEAGEYTLQYTATDACGNTTVVERELTVKSPRTVLYTDGTFIINESPDDIDANVALHGEATNVYDPFVKDIHGQDYVFNNNTSRPWNDQRASILSVEFGSLIQPPSTSWWFYDCSNLTSFDATNLDTSDTVAMSSMFYQCSSIQSLDLSGFDTSKVTVMNSMFQKCSALQSVDVSSFNTSLVSNFQNMFADCRNLTTLDISSFSSASATNAKSMFNTCRNLQTIYASTFDASGLSYSNSSGMFNYDTVLVGGAGTTYDSNYVDGTRAKVDGGTSDPGYFTARS